MFLSGKSHGQRRLVGYAIHGVTKEVDTAELAGKNLIAIKLYLIYFGAHIFSFDIILGR